MEPSLAREAFCIWGCAMEIDQHLDKERPVYVFTEGKMRTRKRPNNDGWEGYRIVALSRDESGENLPIWKGLEWWLVGLVQPWDQPEMVLLKPNEEYRQDAYPEARAELEAKGFYLCEEWLGHETGESSDLGARVAASSSGVDVRGFCARGVTPLKAESTTAATTNEDLERAVDSIYERLNKK